MWVLSTLHTTLHPYKFYRQESAVNQGDDAVVHHTIIQNNLISFNPILFRCISKLVTRTSTRSPSSSMALPRSRCRGIWLMWISPSWPTPMSTKDPKCVTFITFPVSVVPVFKSAMDVSPALNRGCSNSAIHDKSAFRFKTAFYNWSVQVSSYELVYIMCMRTFKISWCTGLNNN